MIFLSVFSSTGILIPSLQNDTWFYVCLPEEAKPHHSNHLVAWCWILNFTGVIILWMNCENPEWRVDASLIMFECLHSDKSIWTTFYGNAVLEIAVGHRTFSNQIWTLSDHFTNCSDKMSNHFLKILNNFYIISVVSRAKCTNVWPKSSLVWHYVLAYISSYFKHCNV